MLSQAGASFNLQRPGMIRGDVTTSFLLSPLLDEGLCNIALAGTLFCRSPEHCGHVHSQYDARHRAHCRHRPGCWRSFTAYYGYSSLEFKWSMLSMLRLLGPSGTNLRLLLTDALAPLRQPLPRTCGTSVGVSPHSCSPISSLRYGSQV